MKPIEVTHKLMAGIVDSSIEIFAHGKKILFTQNGKTQDISKLPSDVRKAIEAQMWKNKPAVAILYKWCDNIPDMVDHFTFCNYGGISIKADYDAENNQLNPEVWECPLRGKCEGEGKVCQSTNENRLTGREIEVLQFVAKHTEMPFKTVASELGMAQNTLQQHTKSIYRKTGIHSKPEMVIKAMTLNTL